MIKTVRLAKYNTIKLLDTFLPSVIDTNKGNDKQAREVNIHFGANMDILVIYARGKVLTKDNLERIRILTDVR